jgi:uncharacterized repeat protein (TIGR01451 family)
VFKDVDNLTPQPGQGATFAITVMNNGPDNATGVKLTDLLPTGLTYLSDDSGGSYNPTTGVWTVGGLDVGSKATLQLHFIAENAVQIVNTVTITASDQSDPDVTNNHSSVVLNQVNPKIADLAVQKIVNKSVVISGSNAVFSIVVRNNGPDEATNVSITDVMTTGLSYVSASAKPSQGYYNSATGIWTVGTIPVGAYALLDVSARVTADATNTASVTGVTEFDPDPTNNSASAAITVKSASLSIVKMTNGTNNDYPTGPKLVIGKPVTWSYVVTNTGDVPLTGVAVTDDKEGDVCTIGTMAPTATQTCTKTGTVQAGQYANVGTVTGTDPANQTITATNPDHYLGVVVCDVNGDGKITISDINLIFSAIDLKVGAGDPRDLDGNGIVSINDCRNCMLRCTKARCAP